MRPCKRVQTRKTRSSSPMQILAQLDQYRATTPQFNNYLAFIFARGDEVPVEVRA